MNIKLGISGINWVNEDPHLFDNLYSCDTMLSEMNRLAFDGTEMSRLFPRDPKQLKSILDDKKLRLASGWKSTLFSDSSVRTEEMNSYREHVDFLKAMGCRYVITCEIRDLFDEFNPSRVVPLNEQEWNNLVEGLHEAGRYCRDAGMELVYHFHASTVVESAAEIQRLVDMTDPDLVHLLFDTGHALYGGSDPYELLQQHIKRVRYVHLKDVRAHILDQVKEEQLQFGQAVAAGVFTVPGDGDIDFKPILQELWQHNYEGWLVIEAEQNPAVAIPYEYALKSKAYIESLLGEA